MLITFKKRLAFFLFAMLFFLSIFYIGFSFRMDESFSKELSKNFMLNPIKNSMWGISFV